MKRGQHAWHLLRDYPNALRVRARSLHSRDPRGWEQGDRRPVVLIPGVYETWHFLRVVGDELHRLGHPVHVVRQLGYNLRPIPESATLVAEQLAARGLRDVALVAHSKGGLIGKQLMTTEDPDGRVDRLIAVATPFAGSGMARFTLLPTLRIFRPANAVIRELAAGSNARITSIYPAFDPNIPEGSRLEGARNIEIPVIGHFRVLESPATVQAVIDAVEA